MPTAKFMGRVRVPMYLAPTTISEDFFNSSAISPRQFGDGVVGFKSSSVYSYGGQGLYISDFKAFRLYANNVTSFTNAAPGFTGVAGTDTVFATVNNRAHFGACISGITTTNLPRTCSVSWPFRYSPNFSRLSYKRTFLGPLNSLSSVPMLSTIPGNYKAKLLDIDTYSYTSFVQFYLNGAGSFCGYSFVNNRGLPNTGGALFPRAYLFGAGTGQRVFVLPTPQYGFDYNQWRGTTNYYTAGDNFVLSQTRVGAVNVWYHGMVHITGYQSGPSNFGINALTSKILPTPAEFENPAWTAKFNDASSQLVPRFTVSPGDNGVTHIRFNSATPAAYVNGCDSLFVANDWSAYWEVEYVAAEVFGGYVLNLAAPTTYVVCMDSAGTLYGYRLTTTGQPVGYNAARQYLTSYSLNIPFDPKFLTQDLVNNLTPLNGVNCSLQCKNPVLI